jgi:hypothetical protein
MILIVRVFLFVYELDFITDREYFAESINDIFVAKVIHTSSLDTLLLLESFCMVPIGDL